jgi:hypothetical protein
VGFVVFRSLQTGFLSFRTGRKPGEEAAFVPTTCLSRRDIPLSRDTL